MIPPFVSNRTDAKKRAAFRGSSFSGKKRETWPRAVSNLKRRLGEEDRRQGKRQRKQSERNSYSKRLPCGHRRYSIWNSRSI